MKNSTEPTSIEKIRHTLSHVMTVAVLEENPKAGLGVGPAIEDGFYQDYGNVTFTPEDLPRIEKRMREIIKKKLPMTRVLKTKKEVLEYYKHDPYKIEMTEQFYPEPDANVQLYELDGWLNLCRGGHVENTSEIPVDAFKLTSIAGVYWRSDANKDQLQRIYGVAFESKKELEAYERRMKEAAKRDHRKLGQELDLFTFSDLVGAGLPLYTPRGTLLMNVIREYLNELKNSVGYTQVDIPHLGKRALYETSGHWQKFRESIFRVQGATDEFVLKPMNCPHHTQIYASQPRSYRELPLRYAEITKQYRDEQSGELHGLSRVRSITIDDTHIFCRPDQMITEAMHAYEIIVAFNKTFGLGLEVALSVRDPQEKEKYLGSDAIWEKAEESLKSVLDTAQSPYTIDEGEAAFYGPKIDFVAKDSIGRRWQLSTIQLDFNLPERFKLVYADERGTKTRPVMLHVAVAGSFERFLSVIIEHFAGAFPLWLSPVQVALLPVSEKFVDAAEKIRAEFSEAGLRAQVDMTDESVGKKIRNAVKQKSPYVLVIGEKEANGKKVAVRKRGEEKADEVDKKKFIAGVQKLIESKSQQL